ncbi:thioesterase II family protein [Streptomyces sp. NRRL S-340]|uniref:thioesterase II family protein n=1 Tax=Streptomyces sp. NRRL S-340 TaxID=1463901 RepID=UPI0005692911|nr:alpha/beta fold hydrolase [Streptomyces sp. NRRL S-340]
MDFPLTRINPWYSGGCDGPPRVRLCALPYAGGTAAVFKDWPAALPSGVELLTAHLPGRGDRFAEPPLATVEETAEQLCAALPAGDVPTVVFGHSMGALLGYELAARLAARDRAPSLLIAAGCRPPHVPPDGSGPATPDELAATLRDERPWDEALLDEELREAVLPTLVADIAAGDRYHRPRPCALDLPLKVYIAAADDGTDWRTTLGWRACTTRDCEVVVLPGGHYFVETERAAVLARLAADLAEVTA